MRHADRCGAPRRRRARARGRRRARTSKRQSKRPKSSRRCRQCRRCRPPWRRRIPGDPPVVILLPAAHVSPRRRRRGATSPGRAGRCRSRLPLRALKSSSRERCHVERLGTRRISPVAALDSSRSWRRRRAGATETVARVRLAGHEEDALVARIDEPARPRGRISAWGQRPVLVILLRTGRRSRDSRCRRGCGRTRGVRDPPGAVDGVLTSRAASNSSRRSSGSLTELSTATSSISRPSTPPALASTSRTRPASLAAAERSASLIRALVDEAALSRPPDSWCRSLVVFSAAPVSPPAAWISKLNFAHSPCLDSAETRPLWSCTTRQVL